MESYIYDRTRDGVFYLDLAKTWEKTMVAARIIAAIQEKNKKDVLVSAVAGRKTPAARCVAGRLRRAQLLTRPWSLIVAFLTFLLEQIVSSRTYAQRAVLKFATYTGANYMGGKWVPGTLTNQNTKK
jgi:small subunit ribosomal protein SAe